MQQTEKVALRSIIPGLWFQTQWLNIDLLYYNNNMIFEGIILD